MGERKLTSPLISQTQHISVIASLKGNDIVVLRALQHLCERPQVHAKRYRAVAAVLHETLFLEKHSYERNVRVVHSLKGNAGIIAVEVAVLDKVLDSINNLCDCEELLWHGFGGHWYLLQ